MERSCAINYLSNGGRFHCIKKKVLYREYLVCIVGNIYSSKLPASTATQQSDPSGIRQFVVLPKDSNISEK